MNVLLAIIIILACVLLVVVVMLQNSKGGGLDQSFGVTNQLGGAAQSTETIEKITWYLAGGIAALCLISVIFISSGGASATTLKTNIESGASTTQMPAPSPSVPAQQEK